MRQRSIWNHSLSVYLNGFPHTVSISLTEPDRCAAPFRPNPQSSLILRLQATGSATRQCGVIATPAALGEVSLTIFSPHRLSIIRAVETVRRINAETERCRRRLQDRTHLKGDPRGVREIPPLSVPELQQSPTFAFSLSRSPFASSSP